PESIRIPIIGGLLWLAATINGVTPLFDLALTSAPRSIRPLAISIGRVLPGRNMAPSAGSDCPAAIINGVSASGPDGAFTLAPASINALADSYLLSPMAKGNGRYPSGPAFSISAPCSRSTLMDGM